MYVVKQQIMSLRAWTWRAIETDCSGRAVEGLGLRPLSCWYYGFKSRRRYGCLWCCRVEVPAWGRSLVRRSHTECVVSALRNPWPTTGCWGGRDPLRAVAPCKNSPKEPDVKWIILRGSERKWSWPIWSYYHDISVERLKNTLTSRNSRCLSQDLNLGPLEYESVVLHN